MNAIYQRLVSVLLLMTSPHEEVLIFLARNGRRSQPSLFIR